MNEPNAQEPSEAMVRRWLSTFLANPHPGLGRTGAVCPYVEAALIENAVEISTFAESSGAAAIEVIVANAAQDLVARMRDRPDLRPLHVSVLVFPKADAATIDLAQDRAKDAFVERGLMIGEFHPQHKGPGLHNREFHPMRAPVPMLVIREMVRQDIVFLDDPRRYSEERVRWFLECYNRLFRIREASER